ncbi:MAG TPA: PEGA domain-containing protein [Kofleriaceae bacterium]|nr:PEGA domain-containing protein [Kofleriaceae bacterium]
MSRTGLAFVAFASLSLALPSVSVAQEKPKVAVLGIQVVPGKGGVDKRAIALGKALTRGLRDSAASGHGPYTLAPNAEKDLLSLKLLSGCGSEARGCMAAIGKNLGAQRLLYGKLTNKDKSYQISLMLLDVTTERMERTVKEEIPEGEATKDGMTALAGDLYARLTGGPQAGTLTVSANVDSGTVFVDGQAQTSLAGGMAKITGLAAGPHTITVEAPGYAPYDHEITVVTGEAASLEATLVPVEAPAADGTSGYKIAFWSSLVVTGAAGAGWAITAVKVSHAEQDVQDAMVGSCDDSPVPSQIEDACNSGNSASTWSYVFGTATVVAGLATSYFLYKAFIDKDDDGVERSAHDGDGEPAVTVAPAFGPNFVGGGLAIEF